MVILFSEVESFEQDYFKREFPRDTLRFVDAPLDVESVDLSDVEALAIFIHTQVTPELLDKMPNLRFIATMSTGFDHINLEECKKRGITVSNVPTYGESTVAEHTFALLLAISRKLIESVDRTKKGEFLPVGLTGFDLKGKTIGVIGVGSIGENVIKIAKGFGMNVIAYKRTPDHVMEQKLGFAFVDLPLIFQNSDVITLHLPYSKETHHFLNADAFSQMKEGVIILNTARGSLIDSAALLQALESGKVGAAGLDVLEEEPLLVEERDLLSKQFDVSKLMSVIQDHMLVNNPKVIITPHNAFNSKEALQKIVESTHENIASFSAGAPINVVQ